MDLRRTTDLRRHQAQLGIVWRIDNHFSWSKLWAAGPQSNRTTWQLMPHISVDFVNSSAVPGSARWRTGRRQADVTPHRSCQTHNALAHRHCGVHLQFRRTGHQLYRQRQCANMWPCARHSEWAQLRHGRHVSDDATGLYRLPHKRLDEQHFCQVPAVSGMQIFNIRCQRFFAASGLLFGIQLVWLGAGAWSSTAPAFYSTVVLQSPLWSAHKILA